MRPEALELFNTFFNEHGPQTAAIRNPTLRAHCENLQAIAARLALIFCLCDKVTRQPGDLSGEEDVQEQHVLAGIALARWYGSEAMRVYDGSGSHTERDTQELLDVIRKHGGSITPRAMGRRRVRWANPEVAEKALRDLERAGHGTCELQPPGPNGGRTKLVLQAA